MENRPVIMCAGGCGRGVRPGQPYTFREILALEQVSRTGGSGTIRRKTFTGRVFCQACGADERPDTERLF